MGGTAGAPRMHRRGVLRLLGTTGALAAAGGLGAGCGTLASALAGPAADTIRIGFVSPASGALAPFGAADRFVLEAMRRHFAEHPIVLAGRGHRVEILDRDSQSDPTRAADVALDLIENGGIHLMLVAATTQTANPVSDQCEANGMPCVATAAPWQPWFYGRAGRAEAPFRWTYDFFWGLTDVEAVYADMWDQVPTNKVSGALWPDDPDGRAWSDPAGGFPPMQARRGYRMIGPASYPDGLRDYSRMIDTFRSAEAEVLVGVPAPADFSAFWKQATRDGFQPKIATIGKALLFPSGVEALGELGVNLGTEVWWSPNHPFSSSLTGQSARQLADAYTAATGRQWVQPIGFTHALFEVAAAAFGAVAAVHDRAGLAAAIGRLRLDTVVGPLDWTRGPVPNVATTPLVGGQWRAGTGSPFELVIVSNTRSPQIPAAGEVETLSFDE